VIVVLIATSVAATSASGRDTGPPRGLTRSGVLLWDFEALLHDTFGSRQVCEITGATTAGVPLPDSGDFVAPRGGCDPLAMYSPYVPVFANARNSPFRLVVRAFPPGAFGNYPGPVRVAHLHVACTTAAKTFLVSYGDAAALTLGCLRPLP
jgi:hypothetical protein